MITWFDKLDNKKPTEVGLLIEGLLVAGTATAFTEAHGVVSPVAFATATAVANGWVDRAFALFNLLYFATILRERGQCCCQLILVHFRKPLVCFDGFIIVRKPIKVNVFFENKKSPVKGIL